MVHPPSLHELQRAAQFTVEKAEVGPLGGHYGKKIEEYG